MRTEAESDVIPVLAHASTVYVGMVWRQPELDRSGGSR